MKPTFKKISWLITGIALCLPLQVFAINPPASITDAADNPIVPEFTVLTNIEGTEGLIPYFINFLLFLVTAVSILFIIIAGYRLVAARGEDEELGKAKTSLLWGMAGLAVITFARILTKIFFEYGRVTVNGTDPQQAIDRDLALETIERITDIGLNLLAAVSILFLLVAGYLFITARGEDEQAGKAKHAVMYGVAGLVVVTLARVLTNIFFTGVVTDPSAAIDQKTALETIGRFTTVGLLLLGAISVFFLLVAGYQFVTARGEDEQIGKAKHSVMYGIGGLVIVTLAKVLTDIFFAGQPVPTPGDAFDPNLAQGTVQTLINFGQLLLGAVAVLFIVIAGFQMVTARGEEEQFTKAKHSLMYAAFGLMAVVLAETIVRIFFNYTEGEVPVGNTQLGIQTVISVTNFALAFVGVIAVLMLIVAGFQYITARGDEGQTEKAKQTIVTAAIGLVIIVFAYVIVKIVITGNV